MPDGNIVGTLSSSVEKPSSSAKRKFVPNIKKALNKHVITDDGPAKKPRKDSKSADPTPNRGGKSGRGGFHGFARDGKSQFVQSYSIFETGIGCVVKNDQNAVELREARPSGTSLTEVHEIGETELKDDPLEQSEAFVTDIKQVFKDPPVVMPDSASDPQPPIDPLSDMDLSGGRNCRVPFDFFTDTGSGRLFTVQLPDKLIPTNSDELKEGRFGKIQVLDNQQVRLVVGEATFELVSPHPLSMASDVVLADQRNEDYVRLNCVGHLDQAMVAVPNLEDFVHLGQ
ncbi:unnamed protein product [Calicophoron daubneyi]|uniref:DNA-directed RNA polymerase III subunit RPC4 n=1 Tax=Calicophoron daubneyi TaxID=300641 RepID=A0AAV2TJZ8_CALDB